jgi:hypothetical protein
MTAVQPSQPAVLGNPPTGAPKAPTPVQVPNPPYFFIFRNVSPILKKVQINHPQKVTKILIQDPRDPRHPIILAPLKISPNLN